GQNGVPGQRRARTTRQVGGSSMTDIVDFLLARIAEDEAAAQAAVVRSDDPEIDGVDTWDVLRGQTVIGPALDQIRSVHLPDGATAEHIARHDPARVLRECDTKRRIVAAHDGSFDGVQNTHPCDGTNGVYDCDTLRALAAVYADHPDFREEWRS